MKELLAITDLTEMWADQVCIAGVTRSLECIRPVTDSGVRLWSLYKNGKPIVYPGAKIWLNLSPAEILPPHIEDHEFDPDAIEYKDRFEGDHWETLLQKTCRESVQSIFDGNLKDRRVRPGAQTRSLGTVGDVKILALRADTRYEGRTILRMDFEDASGEIHQYFPINDLAFRGLYSQIRSSYEDGIMADTQAANTMSKKLLRADRVYLRIGLTRPTVIGSYPEACWVQITGIYTFPDYLDGRIWADF